MDDKEKKDILEPKGVGRTPEARADRSIVRDTRGERTVDFKQEYSDGFQKRLYVQQIQKTAIQNWIDRFPADVILEKIAELGNEETTKSVKEQLNTNVQGWLRELDEMNEASKTLNIDILKTASILARKDRERVE